MLTKEERIAAYEKVKTIFIKQKGEGRTFIGYGMCPELLSTVNMDTICHETQAERVQSLFPEFYSLKPTGCLYSSISNRQLTEEEMCNNDNPLWFAWDDFDSRIGLLTKAIALCELS